MISLHVGSIVRTVFIGLIGLIFFFGTHVSNTAASDFWLLSTRRAPVACPPVGWESWLDYYRFDNECGCQRSDPEAFFSGSEPGVPTTVFVHGNKADRASSITAGKELLRVLESAANDRPFRLVIWSWPSDKISHRPRIDAQVKATQSDTQSFYLAHWLDRMDPGVPVCLVGYSYGVRVITGAMHMRGGGEVAGLRMRARTVGEPRPIRSVLIAAAIPNDWLLSGRRNGLAVSQLDRLLLTTNRLDPILKLFPRIERPRGPKALGFTGPCLKGLNQIDRKLECLSMESEVGRAHGWRDYLGSPSLLAHLGRFSLTEPLLIDSGSEPKPALAVSGP